MMFKVFSVASFCCGLKQWKLVFSPFWRLGNPRLVGSQLVPGESSLPLADGCLFPVSSHGEN